MNENLVKITPKERAFIFPGQGSQRVGMGKNLVGIKEADEVFKQINIGLDKDLTKIMFEGPAQELNLTENTQPAIMAVSLALCRIIESYSSKKLYEMASFVAGHSLGEYSALAAIGGISLRDCAKVLKLRGQSMAASFKGPSMVAAVLGFSWSKVEKILSEIDLGDEICQCANDNTATQVVISGTKKGVEIASTAIKTAGARRVIPLPVSVPVHSSLMNSASKHMNDVLNKLNINELPIPIVSNYCAKPTVDPEVIRDMLKKQISGTVKWKSTIELLTNKGITEFVEIGNGKILSSLVSKIEPKSNQFNIQNQEDIACLISKIKM